MYICSKFFHRYKTVFVFCTILRLSTTHCTNASFPRSSFEHLTCPVNLRFSRSNCTHSRLATQWLTFPSSPFLFYSSSTRMCLLLLLSSHFHWPFLLFVFLFPSLFPFHSSIFSSQIFGPRNWATALFDIEHAISFSFSRNDLLLISPTLIRFPLNIAPSLHVFCSSDSCPLPKYLLTRLKFWPRKRRRRLNCLWLKFGSVCGGSPLVCRLHSVVHLAPRALRLFFPHTLLAYLDFLIVSLVGRSESPYYSGRADAKHWPP